VEKGKKVELIVPQKKKKRFFILLDLLHKARKQDKMPACVHVLCWSHLQADLYLLEDTQNDFESNLKNFAENFPASLAHPALFVIRFFKM